MAVDQDLFFSSPKLDGWRIHIMGFTDQSWIPRKLHTKPNLKCIPFQTSSRIYVTLAWIANAHISKKGEG